MKVDHNLVMHIAKLARIRVDVDELDMYSTQLESILNFIDQLNEFQSEAVEAPAIEEISALVTGSDDVVEVSDIREKAIEQAPKKTGTSFVVPKVVEG